MIIPIQELFVFAIAACVMAISPGPNMIYLVSRSLCQGPQATVVSLYGVALGFVLHMFVAAFGLTAFFLAVPLAYDALKYAGAAYLLWLAWQAVKPGAKGLFTTQELAPDSPTKLVWMGFLTNALNPKIAVFYVSIFSQFLNPVYGSILLQSLLLGCIQIAISFSVNVSIIYAAGKLSLWFETKPLWTRIQRWFMASILSGLALKLALSEKR